MNGGGLVNINVTTVFKTRAMSRYIHYYRHARTTNSDQIYIRFISIMDISIMDTLNMIKTLGM